MAIRVACRWSQSMVESPWGVTATLASMWYWERIPDKRLCTRLVSSPFLRLSLRASMPPSLPMVRQAPGRHIPWGRPVWVSDPYCARLTTLRGFEVFLNFCSPTPRR